MQWSLQGDELLLAGATSLWLLDVQSGELKPLVSGEGSRTGWMFVPTGDAVSYVQDNDLYTVGIADGQVQRLTTDGGETIFNGGLDWVYNEELATRAAQPGYGWSPDGVWLMYLRLDETAVPNDPVTDFRSIPATVSYTRYPTAGTPNPVASLHALTPTSDQPPLEVPLPADAEYVLPFFTWTPDSNHALYITVNRDHITRIVPTDSGNPVVLVQTAGPARPLPRVSREFVTVKAHDGTELYAQLVKPENFDPARKYPVVVHWYGGPGLQMVSNRYGATNIFNIIERDVLYTPAGFLVWRLDNRGSAGRGHAFETPIFGQHGPAALDDQLAGIEYLATLPYVDATRIGTDGKSFGGYMTLYALIHAPDVFRCGVAGAAPTDWRYYDTIYTERYMRTPQQNPEGYAATNLIAQVDQLQAAPLLIHGLADTNVHLQNTVNFVQALEAADKPFSFIPLPNRGHSFRGDGLVAALMASVDYLKDCLTSAE